MIKLVAIAVALALSAAWAQTYPMGPYKLPFGPMQPGGVGGPMIPGNVAGSAPPVSCSNSLDLSKACNSQYIGTLS